MVYNEQGFWRLTIALGAGAAAAVVSSAIALAWAAVRRDVHPAVPIIAGTSVAVTIFGIDWYTERQEKQRSE